MDGCETIKKRMNEMLNQEYVTRLDRHPIPEPSNWPFNYVFVSTEQEHTDIFGAVLDIPLLKKKLTRLFYGWKFWPSSNTLSLSIFVGRHFKNEF